MIISTVVMIIRARSDAGQGMANVTTTTFFAAAVTSCVDVPELFHSVLPLSS